MGTENNGGAAPGTLGAVVVPDGFRALAEGEPTSHEDLYWDEVRGWSPVVMIEVFNSLIHQPIIRKHNAPRDGAKLPVNAVVGGKVGA